MRVAANVALSKVASEDYHSVKLGFIKGPRLTLGSLVTLKKANALKGTYMAYSAIRFGFQFILCTDIC